MAEQLKIDLLSLGGGQVDGIPATHIGEHEFVRYVNFYPYGTKAVRRRGMARITSSAHSERLTSLFALKLTDGTWALIAGRQTGISKLSGTAWVDIMSDATYASNSYPWHMRQYKDIGYAVRRGTGALKRFTVDSMRDAGIAAPSAAPTLADGGAGSLPAGNYYGVYTFYNRNTGVESNPSSASGVLALGASKQIAWTNIGVSTNGQVTSRRLYRTLENQTGEYYLVAEIADNFTTTYTDNILKSDLGAQASFDNGLPPSVSQLFEIHKERAFVSDGKDVSFSAVGLIECFAEDDLIQVYPDDGHELRVLLSWGDRLVMGKTNGVHYLVGTDRSNFAVQTLSNRHGMYSQLSAKVIEGALYWFGGDDFYRSDGGSPEPIGRHKIRAILEAIPDGQKENVTAAVFPSLGWYLASVPQTSGGNNAKVLVYNYKTDTWCVFTHPSDAPAFLGDFFDTNYGQILYATLYDGHLYQYHSGNTDYDNAIQAELLTGEHGFNNVALMKGSRRLHVLCSTVPENLTVKVYRDGSSTSTTSRTVSLNQDRKWKRIELSTMGKLGTTLQYGLTYSGTQPLEIEAMSAELAAFRRASQPV